MSTDTKTQIKGPFDDLPQEDQKRLKRISSEISFDKLTVSFSIEDRDGHGRKKSAFYSVTASRGTGAEITTMGEDRTPAGFNAEDVGIARALLCKHVVKATYDDAIRRRIVSTSDAQEECRSIIGSYDKLLVHLLSGKNGVGTGDAK